MTAITKYISLLSSVSSKLRTSQLLMPLQREGLEGHEQLGRQQPGHLTQSGQRTFPYPMMAHASILPSQVTMMQSRFPGDG